MRGGLFLAWHKREDWRREVATCMREEGKLKEGDCGREEMT
jgi:hypothetical protein